MFVDLAIQGKVDVLVTGDRDLLAMDIGWPSNTPQTTGAGCCDELASLTFKYQESLSYLKPISHRFFRLSPIINMSYLTYYVVMSKIDKPLVWLHGEIKSPPLSGEARLEAGYLLRRLQQNEKITMPHSRPMPGIGKSCHELRIVDQSATWRIIYRTDSNAVVILEVFKKKTKATPKRVINACKKRINFYDYEID